MKKKFVIGIIAVVVIAAAAWGPIVSNVEQAKYTVVKTDGEIEIRDYAPMIVAEVEVHGPRKQAISKGFRMIADFIFGNNVAASNIAMTAPVTQQASEKIAMTAPVTQQAAGDKTWHVRFVMPAKYTMETLPKPNNASVQIKQVTGTRAAVICFSGMADTSSLARHTDELRAYVEKNNLTAVSSPTYAFFNPPWTLPFFRHNEVIIQLQ